MKTLETKTVCAERRHRDVFRAVMIKDEFKFEPLFALGVPLRGTLYSVTVTYSAVQASIELGL